MQFRQLIVSQVFYLIATLTQLVDHCLSIFTAGLNLHAYIDMRFTAVSVAIAKLGHHTLA